MTSEEENPEHTIPEAKREECLKKKEINNFVIAPKCLKVVPRIHHWIWQHVVFGDIDKYGFKNCFWRIGSLSLISTG